MIGATERQARFAKASLAGLNNTRAAKAAGYSGSDEQLRQAGYRVSRCDKVKALISLAKVQGGGIPDKPGDVAELKRILWRHARGGDKPASLRASEILHRLDAAEKEAVEDRGTPEEAIVKLMDTGRGSMVNAIELWQKAGFRLELCPRIHEALEEAARHFPEWHSSIVANMSADEREALGLPSAPIPLSNGAHVHEHAEAS